MTQAHKRLAMAAFACAAALTASPAFAQGSNIGSTINGADTAWMIGATGLVLMMTIPGLALFYGGLVRRKNVLSVLAQCLGIAGLEFVQFRRVHARHVADCGRRIPTRQYATPPSCTRATTPIRCTWMTNSGCRRNRRMNSAASRLRTSSQTRQ